MIKMTSRNSLESSIPTRIKPHKKNKTVTRKAYGLKLVVWMTARDGLQMNQAMKADASIAKSKESWDILMPL